MLQINAFAAELGKHYTLVDGWFKDLEANRIHYISRLPNGEKVYDDLDLEVGKYILEKRTGKAKWSFPGIHEALKEEFGERLRPFPKEYDDAHLPAAGDVRQLMNYFQSILGEEVAALKLLLPTPIDPLTERQNRLNSDLARIKVTTALRKEAIEKWNQKPVGERYTKVGLFGKMENQIARSDFIQDFIDAHIAARLKEEYGL